VRLLLLAGGALLLESLRVAWLARIPGAPDLLLGAAVLLALRRRPASAAATGFLLGALRDLLAGEPLGVETAAFTVAAWAASSLGRTIYRESVVTQAVMILGAVLLRGWIRYIALSADDATGLFLYLVRVSLPSAVITALLLPWLAHRLARLRPRRRRRRRGHLPPHETPVFE
jgi:rod shape-determining protein MreD